MITAAAAHQLLLRPISYRVIAAAADRLLLVPISYVGCVLLQLSPGVAPQTHPVVVDSRPTQYPHEDQPGDTEDETHQWELRSVETEQVLHTLSMTARETDQVAADSPTKQYLLAGQPADGDKI
eukprot:GHUV01020671.1.p1 GENE.GHUV01020671.1~~GHUV01020671.1.p1  ORF type:complete len:124 (-),score=35.31 GHUV01020671.1:1914-2285(-)